MQAPRKLIELEALRGLAALVVLLHHFMLGFAPRLHGVTYPDQPFSLSGTPLFAVVNGSAAVIVFFVLSGFVLSLRVLRTGSAGIAVAAALKRWPRLAGPVVLTNLLAGVLMATGSFRNVETAAHVPSIWLGWFYTWPSVGWSEIPSSLWEGATTFVTGQALYNSSLWTMVYEFVGSFVVLAAALLVARLAPRYRLPVLAVIALATFWVSPYVAPFVVGVVLALRYETGKLKDWGRWQSLLAVAAILFLAGYHENFANGLPEGVYVWLSPVTAWDPLRLRVVLHTGAATIALLTFLRTPPVRHAMTGRLGWTLGFLSFGIYLAQIPVICSVSSMTFGATTAWGRIGQIMATFMVTIAGTLALAVPVAFFDRWWVGQVSATMMSKRTDRGNPWLETRAAE